MAELRADDRAPPYLEAVEPDLVLAVLVPIIAVVAYVGGTRMGTPKRRVPLAAAGLASAAWIALLIALKVGAS